MSLWGRKDGVLGGLRRQVAMLAVLVALLAGFGRAEATPVVTATLSAAAPLGNSITVDSIGANQVVLAALSLPDPRQVITAPKGWKLAQRVGSFDPASSNTLAVFWILQGATIPPSYTFVFSQPAIHSSVVLLTFNNSIFNPNVSASPFDGVIGQADDIGNTPWYLLPNPPTPSAPAITPTRSGDLVLVFIGSAQWQTYTAPAPLTKVVSVERDYASQAAFSEPGSPDRTAGPFTLTALTVSDFKTISMAVF